MKRNLETHRKVDQIFSSQSSEIDRLAEVFHFILEQHLTDTAREMELLQAMGDKGQLVKEQIKYSTVQHVQSVFDDCYFRATGVSWQQKQIDALEDGNE